MLALDGGKPAVTSPLRPFNTIGPEEINAVVATMKSGPLSGYLGGERHGGIRVEALEHEFAGILGVKHAIACNSATSGLLIASAACGVDPKTAVLVSPFTMSATAAAPRFLGADIAFGDIDPDTFNLNHWPVLSRNAKVVITTNLFGHPARLDATKEIAGMKRAYMIEDNAQGIFAMEDGKYAGTIGDVGVFSFNVHKHLQCGEGGICVTNDDRLADAMRLFRNHAELGGSQAVGLNLRMTEIDAAIILAQLAKRDKIMESRIELAEYLTHAANGILGLIPPTVREGCKHVYYCWALKVPKGRAWFVKAMKAEGVLLQEGYVTPLYRLKAFEKYKNHCPVTEEMHDNTLCLFETCAYDPSRRQMKMIKDAFEKVGEALIKRQVQTAA